MYLDSYLIELQVFSSLQLLLQPFTPVKGNPFCAAQKRGLLPALTVSAGNTYQRFKMILQYQGLPIIKQVLRVNIQ
jgi:hypothetical protein